MSRKTDRVYSLRREKAEREAADRATVPAARDIHNALADRYAVIARARRAKPSDGES